MASEGGESVFLGSLAGIGSGLPLASQGIVEIAITMKWMKSASWPARDLGLLALLVLGLVASRPSLAADACSGASSGSLVADLRGAAEAADGATSTWTLPEGDLSAADLTRAFEQVRARNEGVASLFGLFADGRRRVLKGDVVRALFEKNGVRLDFLPMDALDRIVAEQGRLTFHFAFGGESTREIVLPDSSSVQLESRLKEDPLKVDPRNKVSTRKSEGKTLKISKEVQFSVNAGGIAGLRAGDMQVKAFFWFDVGIRTERTPGRVATDDKRTVLETDASGRPLVRDGRYVPQTWDDWVVLEAGGKRVDIGIPRLPATPR
jgi:hypothetical protein